MKSTSALPGGSLPSKPRCANAFGCLNMSAAFVSDDKERQHMKQGLCESVARREIDCRRGRIPK